MWARAREVRLRAGPPRVGGLEKRSSGEGAIGSDSGSTRVHNTTEGHAEKGGAYSGMNAGEETRREVGEGKRTRPLTAQSDNRVRGDQGANTRKRKSQNSRQVTSGGHSGGKQGQDTENNTNGDGAEEVRYGSARSCAESKHDDEGRENGGRVRRVDDANKTAERYQNTRAGGVGLERPVNNNGDQRAVTTLQGGENCSRMRRAGECETNGAQIEQWRRQNWRATGWENRSRAGGVKQHGRQRRASMGKSGQ